MPEAASKRQCVDLGASPDGVRPNMGGYEAKVIVITHADILIYRVSKQVDWVFFLSSLPVARNKNLLVSIPLHHSYDVLCMLSYFANSTSAPSYSKTTSSTSSWAKRLSKSSNQVRCAMHAMCIVY